MCLNFVEERTRKSDRENGEWRWCQIKSIYRLHLDLVVKQLCYISCLNVVLLIVPLSEINSYVVVLSFYIKMMKRSTLQGCSLSHSIKKAMFYVKGKLDLFNLDRRGVLLPSPPWLRVCLKYYKGSSGPSNMGAIQS